MADRTVSVSLVARVQDYVSGLARAEAATKGVGASAKALDGDEAALGRQFKETAVSGGLLAAELEAVKRKQVDLAREFDRTGKPSLLAQIAASQQYEAQLKRVGKSLEDVGKDVGKEAEAMGKSLGKDAAKGLSNSFGNALDDLLPKMLSNPVTLGVAAAAAPELGVLIGAGIVSGIGLAGIGAGIAVALHDPAVQHSLSDFKTEVAGTFKDAAAPFAVPVERALGRLGSFVKRDLGPGLTGMFAALAPEVSTLEKGVEKFVGPLAAGFERAAIAAKPLIDDLSTTDLPEIGQAIGDAFDTIAANAPEAKKGLQDLTTLSVGLINNGSRLVDLFGKISDLEQTFSKYDPTGLHNLSKALDAVGINTSELLGTTTSSLTILKKSSDATDVLGTAADLAAIHTRALALQWDALNKALSKDQARIDAKNQIANIATAIDKHSSSLDINTEAGRHNRGAIEDSIKALEDDRDALIANGTHAEDANKLFQGWVKTLEAAAVKAGISKSAVRKLNEQLGLIPKSKTVTIKIRATGDKDVYLSASGRKLSRWGGVYTHAAEGALRDATVYPAANPGRYMIAEPQTGGEAFIPRFGDYARSIGILSTAAAWYGAHVVPGNRGGSSLGAQMGGRGGITVENLNVRAYSDRFSIAQVQRDLALYGVH